MSNRCILVLCILLLLFLINNNNESFNSYGHPDKISNYQHPELVWRHGVVNDTEVSKDPNDLTKEGNPIIIFIWRYDIPKWEKSIKNSKRKFVIILDNDDSTVPTEYHNGKFIEQSSTAINKLLNSPQCIQIFSANARPNYEKTTQIPLGIDYHTRDKHLTAKQQEDKLINIYRNAPNIRDRNLVAVVGWKRHIDNANGLKKRGGIKMNRREYLDRFPKNILRYEDSGNRDKFWEVCSQSAFVICPVGNGYDTHRLWEVLTLGCIAIVQSTPLDSFMKQFPVIVTDTPQNLTKEKLREYVNQLGGMTTDPNVRQKYTMRYWKDLMKRYLVSH